MYVGALDLSSELFGNALMCFEPYRVRLLLGYSGECLLRRRLAVYYKEDLDVGELLFGQLVQELHDIKNDVFGDHLCKALWCEVAHEHGHIAEDVLAAEVYLFETGLYIPAEPCE